MHLSDSTLVFAATDVSGFLACPHLTTLNTSASELPSRKVRSFASSGNLRYGPLDSRSERGM